MKKEYKPTLNEVQWLREQLAISKADAQAAQAENIRLMQQISALHLAISQSLEPIIPQTA